MPKNSKNSNPGTRPRFPAGKSGNPGGRPRGAKSAVKLLAAEFITDADVRAVVAAVVGAARQGDMQAAALVLDRMIPKVRPVAADPEAEVELAAALAAARAKSLAGFGVSLEQLVVLTGVNEPEAGTRLPPPIAAAHSDAATPSATAGLGGHPDLPAEPQQPTGGHAPAPPPRRISIPVSAASGQVERHYNPFDR